MRNLNIEWLLFAQSTFIQVLSHTESLLIHVLLVISWSPSSWDESIYTCSCHIKCLFLDRHLPRMGEGALTSSPSWSALACMSDNSLRISDSSAMADGGMRCSPLNKKCGSYCDVWKREKDVLHLIWVMSIKADGQDKVEWKKWIYEWIKKQPSSANEHLKTINRQVMCSSRYVQTLGNWLWKVGTWVRQSSDKERSKWRCPWGSAF